MTRRRRIQLSILATAAVVVAGYALLVRPSNARDWTPNEAKLPAAEFRASHVTLRNVRNTRYLSPNGYTTAYYDTTVDLDRLTRVWFVVEPFSDNSPSAHTFLSFEFRGGTFIAISVEARKERGERYNVLKGLFRRYELMYVVADERDVIGLRTNYRKDAVFLYPMRAEPQRARALFVAMLTRANQLRDDPEFYNSLTANCTSTIVRHVNSLAPGTVPFSYRRLLPGYADRLAYDLGLIDTDVAYDSLRTRFRITERAQAMGIPDDFSSRIRVGLQRRS
jgi:hypothetical protein